MYPFGPDAVSTQRHHDWPGQKLAAKAQKQEEAKRKKEATRLKKQEQVRSLPLAAGSGLRDSLLLGEGLWLCLLVTRR